MDSGKRIFDFTLTFSSGISPFESFDGIPELFFAESGISTRDEVVFAQECGATAILVGEALVRSESPTVAINQLLGRL